MIDRYVSKAQDVANALRSIPQVRLVPEHPPTNMMHAYLDGDPDRFVTASMQIAEEDRVWLLYRVGPSGKIEINVGEGALGLGEAEIWRLFTKLFALAGD